MIALRERIKELEQKWFAQEERIMSADSPNIKELNALAIDASREEDELIEEFHDENWQVPLGRNRYARYWLQKNKKLGLEREL